MTTTTDTLVRANLMRDTRNVLTRELKPVPVSYTHLTLPTIYSV